MDRSRAGDLRAETDPAQSAPFPETLSHWGRVETTFQRDEGDITPSPHHSHAGAWCRPVGREGTQGPGDLAGDGRALWSWAAGHRFSFRDIRSGGTEGTVTPCWDSGREGPSGSQRAVPGPQPPALDLGGEEQSPCTPSGAAGPAAGRQRHLRPPRVSECAQLTQRSAGTQRPQGRPWRPGAPASAREGRRRLTLRGDRGNAVGEAEVTWSVMVRPSVLRICV